MWAFGPHSSVGYIGFSEWEGFEPSVPVTQYNSLANYRIRPLCHHSRDSVCGEEGILPAADLAHPCASEEVGFEPTRPVKV